MPPYCFPLLEADFVALLVDTFSKFLGGSVSDSALVSAETGRFCGELLSLERSSISAITHPLSQYSLNSKCPPQRGYHCKTGQIFFK